ncbi:MAG TPA: redoxin domain-containing protein [Polyangia bacterium]|nr:redoxin domain-containing protein [Polyangia bacterium]
MRPSRWFIAAFAISTFAISTLPAGAALAGPAPRSGDKAPAFALKTVDKGDVRALTDLTADKHSQAVALVFLSSRCPYVAQARQPLADLAKEWSGKVTFVGINANQNEPLDEIKSDAALNFPFPMLRDDGSKIADAYAAERTPEVFVVDPHGVIRYHGGVADLGPALRELTAGKAVSKAESRAFGCTIKRKP